MKKTIIDISVPLENDVASDPPGYEPHIEYLTHKQTTQEILNFFPGLKEEDLPEGQGWAIEWIRPSNARVVLGNTPQVSKCELRPK